MTSTPSPSAPPPDRAPAVLLFTWLAAVLALLSASLIHSLATGQRTLADVFLLEQDLPALAVAGAVLVVWRLAPLPAPALRLDSRPRLVVTGLGLFALAVGAIGGWTVYRNYPLSMDEYMAGFDASILASGRLLAAVPDAWREYVGALQPYFRLHVAGNTHWASDYLPVNAAFRALAGLVGAEGLTGGLWSAVSVAATYGVGRRLWPAARGPALLAAAFVATSSQVLVAGMTAYAMPAHLALNMVWLWLFLRRDGASQGAAALVAFAACGLHQLVFHPLFAGPFVLHLWLTRRWGKAAFHTAAYLAIGLFWTAYPGLALGWSGAEAAAGAGGAAGLVGKIGALLGQLDLARFGYMPKNLLRFVAWQNPLMIVLALAGAVPAWRAGGEWRPLIAGVVLTVVAVSLLMPFQGHGWGYRYLHGFIGSFALAAAFGGVHLAATDKVSPRALRAGLVAGFAASVVLLLPLRLFQVDGFVAPYAAARDAIARTPADLVLVDAAGLFYADDLVRNDPFLTHRPVAADLASLKPDQLAPLCAGRTVAVFSARDGARYGIRETAAPATADTRELRRRLRQGACPDRREIAR
jgi:hypothetical protein